MSFQFDSLWTQIAIPVIKHSVFYVLQLSNVPFALDDSLDKLTLKIKLLTDPALIVVGGQSAWRQLVSRRIACCFLRAHACRRQSCRSRTGSKLSSLVWPTKALCPSSTIGCVPYKNVIDRPPSGILPLRLFASLILYYLFRRYLQTFRPMLQGEVSLYHVDGGICNILTVTGVLRTKHVRIMERYFPRAVLTTENEEGAGDGISEISEVYIETALSDLHYQSKRATADSDSEGEDSPEVKALIYTLAKPTLYREKDSVKKEESSGDSDNESCWSKRQFFNDVKWDYSSRE